MTTSKQAPARKAPAKQVPAKKAAPKKTAVATPIVYSAVGRGGVVRRSTSTTPLSHAVDVKIAGRKAPQFANGVVVAFFASEAAAQAACDKINSAKGGDWSDAVVAVV